MEKIDLLEKISYKSTYWYSANILRSVLQSCWREILKILRCVTNILRCDLTKSCSGNMPRSFLQKYWKICKKYRKVLCKNTDSWSANILRNVLQNYWDLFCWNTERCYAKLLNDVLKNCWKEFRTLTQNEQLSFKNSGTWSVSCYIMASYFRRPKDNK